MALKLDERPGGIPDGNILRLDWKGARQRPAVVFLPWMSTGSRQLGFAWAHTDKRRYSLFHA